MRGLYPYSDKKPKKQGRLSQSTQRAQRENWLKSKTSIAWVLKQKACYALLCELCALCEKISFRFEVIISLS
jgi:hypothetical protein